jgi:hypothetical protein
MSTPTDVRYIIAIDPSIRSIGVAEYDRSLDKIVLAHGIAQPSSQGEYFARALTMVDSVIRVGLSGSRALRSVSIVCETPAHWHTQKGLDSEASESVQKLYWFVGALVSRLQMYEVVHSLYVVRPSDWKGQTPKSIMVERSTTYLLSTGFRQADIDLMTHDTHESCCLARWFHRKLRTGLGNMKDLKSLHEPGINVDSASPE